MRIIKKLVFIRLLITLVTTSSRCIKVKKLGVRSNSTFVPPIDNFFDEFLSPITFKLVADVYYGSNVVPIPKAYVESIKNKSLDSLLQTNCHFHPGVVIFVETIDLKTFFKFFYDRIKVPFVLVSGDSDFSSPNGVLVYGNDKKYLVPTELLEEKFINASSHIIHWYGMNCAYNPLPNRFTCLMNGLNQWGDIPDQQRHVLQNLSRHLIINRNSPLYIPITKNDSFNILASFSVWSNKRERPKVWNMFCNEENVKRSLNVFCVTELNQEEYYHLVASSHFVLSPPGSGLDCYRTYEALYLGAYVIAKSSSLDEMFVDLPVLLVKQWSDVTPTLLKTTKERFDSASFDYNKLYLSYWNNHQFTSYGYPRFAYHYFGR